MSDLIQLAASVMEEHGWRTQDEAQISQAHYRFDLIAENDAAVVFFEETAADQLVSTANALAGEIASLMLQPSTGVKAWEAYLVLLVNGGYDALGAVAQSIQRDLTFCRKIVLDGERIVQASEPRDEISSQLSFLFPLDAAAQPRTENVREHLVALIVEEGFDEGVVSRLVDSFDEADCRCWERVMVPLTDESEAAQ